MGMVSRKTNDILLGNCESDNCVALRLYLGDECG